MVETVRYLCVALLDGIQRLFLWESDDETDDRVALDEAGFLLCFPSEFAARAATQAESRPVSSEAPSVYDLDAIEAWCRSTATVTDCRRLLNAWNLFGDLPRNDNLCASADARNNSLYDKLFAGCNLPAMTPPGEEYVPMWTSAEIAALKRLLLLGLAEFRARLR
ncbi:MAG: hypothetical protein H0T42_09680 [Deltaproteobacteria bacterium]|nr:hypothetical protein [Deltaproteobacteria bacterium]